MPDEKKKAMPDEMDEREPELEQERERPEEKAPPRPAAVMGPNVVFNRAVRVWVVLTAFLMAAALYFLPPAGFFLSKPLGGLKLGDFEFTTMLPVAAAVFVGLLLLAFKFFGPLFDYQKPGQGRWVRLSGYLGVGAMSLFAGVTLHQLPQLGSAWWEPALASTSFLGVDLTLRPIFFAAAALFFLLTLAYHLFINRPRWADFLIETQGELRKVSWPPRHEWIASATVVVVVVAFISVFLFLVDEGLSKILQSLRIGF